MLGFLCLISVTVGCTCFIIGVHVGRRIEQMDQAERDFDRVFGGRTTPEPETVWTFREPVFFDWKKEQR